MISGAAGATLSEYRFTGSMEGRPWKSGEGISDGKLVPEGRAEGQCSVFGVSARRGAIARAVGVA